MPLIKIQTNQPLAAGVDAEILSRATSITAGELGKPESIMMATLETGKAMSFGGSSDPTALFEIEGIELSPDPAESLCRQLCDLSEELLNVPANRVFVKLTNVPRGNWGGNRKVY